MERNAIISVKSFNDLDEKDVIEVVTPGKLILENEVFKAIYEETEISGMSGTITTLNIKEDELILLREGTTNAQMHFKKGEKAVSLYSTPFGALDLELTTKSLDINIDENGGEISIDYSMEFSSQPPINTKLSINIKVQ